MKITFEYTDKEIDQFLGREGTGHTEPDALTIDIPWDSDAYDMVDQLVNMCVHWGFVKESMENSMKDWLEFQEEERIAGEEYDKRTKKENA